MKARLKINLPEHILSLLLVAILILILILTINSSPGDEFYHLKKTWYNAESFVAPGNLKKATVRLNIAQDLLREFKTVQSKNPQDPKLIAIAQELVGEEQAGIYYLDLAKKEHQTIDPEVKVLCDGLEQQQIAIFEAYQAASPQLQPQLHEILSQTDIYLSQALNW